MRSKPISYIARLWILPMLMAIFSVSLQAQEPGQQSWDNLKQLPARQKIQVVQMDMKSLKGRFLVVSEEAISLRVKKKSVTIPRAEVLRVSLSGEPKRGRSALAGAGIGAVAGAIIGAVFGAGYGEGPQAGALAAGFAVLGAIPGAAVGAGIPFVRSYQTIYRAKRKRRGKFPTKGR